MRRSGVRISYAPLRLAAIHPAHFQRHTFQEALPVDIPPPAMDAGGDKMATNAPVRGSLGCSDRNKKRGPFATVKFGSAVVPISENLAAWLEPFPRSGRVIPSGEILKAATALARVLGLGWPRNVLRHSFITY